MFENLQLCFEKKERASTHCCWCLNLTHAPFLFLLFAIVGILWTLFELEAENFHLDIHPPPTNYGPLFGALAPSIYILAFVVAKITKNPKWLVRAATANLVVYPVSEFIS